MKKIEKISRILMGCLLTISSLAFINPNEVFAASDFSRGKGTSDDPYIITDFKELQNVNKYCGSKYKSLYFKIDTGTKVLDIGNKQLSPICQMEDGTDVDSVYGKAFYGHFDGNNTEIINITINTNGYSGGLFGATNGATISNVGIGETADFFVNGKIQGSEIGPVGGIVGSAWNTTLENVWNKADINTEHSSAGGIVGRLLSGSTITNAYNTGTISAKVGKDNKSMVGGIVGYMSKSTIQNVANYSNDIIGNGDSDSIGLLVGWIADSDNIIKNAYTMKENTNLNGWGHADENSLVDENVSGYARSELKNKENFYGFDFDNVWKMGDEYPVLTGTYTSSTYTPASTTSGITIKYNDIVIDVENFLYNDGRTFVNLFDFCKASNLCSVAQSEEDKNIYFIDKNVDVTGDKVSSDNGENTQYSYRVMHTKGDNVYYPYIIIGGTDTSQYRTIRDDVTNQVSDVPSCPADAEEYICDENKFYVPVRFLTQSLGLRVEWDGENQIVNIRNNFLETFLSKYDIVTTTTKECNDSSCIVQKDGTYTKVNKNKSYYLNVLDKTTNERMEYYKFYSFYDSVKNIGSDNNPTFKKGVFTINKNKITVDNPTENDQVFTRNMAQIIIYEIQTTDAGYQESDYNAGGYPIVVNNVFVCKDC